MSWCSKYHNPFRGISAICFPEGQKQQQQQQQQQQQTNKQITRKALLTSGYR